MRIQHNIAALNSYRQLGNNNNALSKNLEKLSSGYKINRAGDDAAGLAISEKMRAQIKGLEAAKKNSNDAISLVQTAEGALTEVHDMLNRMTYLATQSANGTYDDQTDRAALQEEVDALLQEINRISNATNFNNINLLDGKMGTAGGAGGATDGAGLSAILKAGTAAEVAAGNNLDNIDASTSLAWAKIGAKAVEELGLTEAGDITISFKVNGDDKVEMYAKDAANNEKLLATSTAALAQITDGDTADVDFGDLGKITLNSDGGGTDASVSDQKTQLEALHATVALSADTGAGEAEDATAATIEMDFTGKTATADASKTYDLELTLDGGTKVTLAGAGAAGGTSLADALGQFDGQEVTIGSGDDAVTYKASYASDKLTLTAKDTGEVAELTITGMKLVETGTTTELTLTGGTVTPTFTNGTGTAEEDGGTAGNGSLTMQIGDTNASYNQITVKIADMSTKGLGIDKVNIKTQKGAQAAIQTIKTAINKVSTERGKLGAVQNRLEHTINNLGTTTENITDAESRIRDTDMAEEMMAYTKNNILVQAAQSMLAQANQVPQGVLQLLQ